MSALLPKTIQSWNWLATSSSIVGLLARYLRQYVYPFSLVAIQSLIVSRTACVFLNIWLKSKKMKQIFDHTVISLTLKSDYEIDKERKEIFIVDDCK